MQARDGNVMQCNLLTVLCIPESATGHTVLSASGPDSGFSRQVKMGEKGGGTPLVTLASTCLKSTHLTPHCLANMKYWEICSSSSTSTSTSSLCWCASRPLKWCQGTAYVWKSNIRISYQEEVLPALMAHGVSQWQEVCLAFTQESHCWDVLVSAKMDTEVQNNTQAQQAPKLQHNQRPTCSDARKLYKIISQQP